MRIAKSAKWGFYGLVLTALTLFIGITSHAQSQVISGVVRDSKSQEPVAGASVMVKGSRKGVTTDANGKFVLQAAPGLMLDISAIGYSKQEVPATQNASIQLVSTNQQMAEVVVVGYGTQKKATLSGAITTVDAKAFQNKGPIDNPLQALQGQVPGVVITRSSAAPGREGWNMQIRGATSINGSDPLVIVDGIPLVSLNALSSINPDDIESISFLKDASTAIYGARGAGGVVLVTTKTAKSGKAVIQYDGSVSMKMLGLMPHLLNVQQFGQGLMDATTNDYYGVAPTNYIWYKMGFLMKHAPDSAYLDMNYTYNIDPTTGQITYVGTPTTPSSNPINPGFGDVKDLTFFNTNYADLLWHNSSSTQQNISVASRTEKAGYRLSLGYMGDGSLLAWGQNSNKRYNVRLTNDFKPIERLKIETNISLDKNDIVQPSNTGYLSQYQQPGFPVQTKNGMAYAWGTQYSANWLAALGGENKEYNTRIFSTLKSTFDFTRNFRFVGQGSYNWNITDNKVESKSINWWNYAGTIQAPDNPTQQNSSYQRQLIKDPYYNLNGYFDYQNKFNGIHTVGVTAGGNYERDEFDSYTARTTYLASNNIPSLNLGIGDNTTKTVTESMNHYAIGSFFSRFNYGFKNKYLFEANLRYDGSSKFDISNRWKAFYGFSGAWRISDESFMQKQKLFNDLKLRASWGEAGNQNGISLYDYIQLLNVSATGGATSSGFPIIGSSPAVLVSPTSGLVSLNRSWETVRTTNFGTDFTLLQNKLNGSFDYFIKNNLNMLLPQTLPAVLGATPPTANLGHLRTWGWETTIQWRDHIGNFNYHLGGSLTDNQNKLVDLKGSKIITPGYNNAVEGYAIGTYFGLKYAGRIQDQKTADDINAIFAGNQISMPAKTINSSGVITTPGVRPGDNYYVDVNGDGKFTIPGDLVPLGTDAPRYTFSFNLGADWNGFDISAIFQGVGKRTILRGYNFNSSTGLISFGDNWAVPFSSIFQGQPNYWWGQTWTTDNPGAYYPRLSAAQNANGNENLYNYYPSTWSAQNGAYIRLKNLVIGYTLPQHLLTRSGIQKLRVYFSGNDLWELTHIHDGWDPEATKDIGRVNSASAFQRYPFYRLLTAGVNVTF